MAVSASDLKSTYPAAFMLPLSDELSSIEGWLELDAERVSFRNGAGLELRMRRDRIASLSVSPEEAESDPQESDPPPPSEVGAEGDIDDATPTADADRPPRLIRLAGECGPAAVCWELLINSEDALTLGQELSVALGDTIVVEGDLGPAVVTIDPDSGLDDDLASSVVADPPSTPTKAWPRRLIGLRPRRRPDATVIDHRMLIRRRRIIAAILVTVALVVAIEVTVTVFLISG